SLFRSEGCEFVKGARSVPVGAGARPRVHCTKHATPLPGQPKEGLQGGCARQPRTPNSTTVDMMQLASVPITVGDAATVVPGGQSSGYGKKNGTMAVPLSVAPKGPRSLLARHTAPPAVRLRYSSPRRAVCV